MQASEGGDVGGPRKLLLSVPSDGDQTYELNHQHLVENIEIIQIIKECLVEISNCMKSVSMSKITS